MIENLKKVRDDITAVTCDPIGVVCIDGSDGDREVIQQALATIDRIIAAGVVVPDGYKLVPIEPTKEMIWSGIENTEEFVNGDPWYGSEPLSDGQAEQCYKAMLSSAPTPAQPEKAIDWAGLDKIRKSATGKTLDQLNAWSYANDTRKAGDNAQPEKLDVEALKREILSDIQAAKAFITGHRAGEKRSGAAKDYLDLVDKVFDHLQSAYKGVENLQCRAPLPKIDGLEEEIRDDDKLHEISESRKRLNDPPRLLSKTQQAARAYLKASGV